MRSPAPLALLVLACAQERPPAPAPSRLQAQLERAADMEGVPRALLIALAYVDSRLSMNQPSTDLAYGLMHLIDRDDAPMALSLTRAARLTGLLPDELRTEPFANARGGAALLRAEAEALFAGHHDLDSRRLGDWWEAVMRLSGGNPAGEVRRFVPGNPFNSCDELADFNLAQLKDLLAAFADAEQPYHPIPRPKWRLRYGKYDHLARIAEWSAIGGEDE